MPSGLHFMPTLNEGNADDSAAIQTVIDNMSSDGGGTVMLPPRSTYKCNIILKTGVLLVGQPTLQKAAGNGVKLIANATGVIVDTPATEINNCGVVGIHTYGLGASIACKGVRFQNVTRGVLQHCTAQNLADEGFVLGSSSNACFGEYLFGQDCLLDRSRSAKAGVLSVEGHDHYVHACEFTASQSSLSDSNAYLSAVLVAGANNMFSGVIGEISDQGFYVSANPGVNRFVNCRADLNFGHGYEIAGSNNMFSACLAWRNSRETNDTYSGFLATSTSRLNEFSACISGGTNEATQQKYGFEDLVVAASGRNVYVGSRGSNNATNDYYANGSGANWDTSTTVVL